MEVWKRLWRCRKNLSLLDLLTIHLGLSSSVRPETIWLFSCFFICY